MRKFFDSGPLAPILPVFMRQLFLAVALVSLMETGLPSLLNAYLYRDRRSGIRSVVLSALKSGGVVAFVRVFISKAYFVDVSDPLGTGALFTLMVTYFMMLNAVPAHRVKPTT